jgi:hypothetical protein
MEMQEIQKSRNKNNKSEDSYFPISNLLQSYNNWDNVVLE